MEKIKIREIKEFLKRLPGILGEQAFLTFLVLVFFALILGGLIFYKYSFLAEKIEPQIIEKPLYFEENLFQEILKIWQIRQKNFEATELKKYPDPFGGLTK